MRCTDCGNETFHDNGFEIVCQRCGLIADEQRLTPVIDRFVEESAVDPRIAVASGAGYSGRIVKSSWMLNRKERNMQCAKTRIELFASRLNLSQRIQTDALVLFSQINEAGLLYGRSFDQFVIAGIYHICMEQGYARTLVELSIQSGVPVREIAKGCSIIRKKFNFRIHTVKTDELIPKYGSDIGLKPSTITKAMELCIKLDSKLPNIPPRTRAVIFLYLASKEANEYVPQRIFSNATGVIERVIRKRSRQYAQFLDNSS